VALSPPRPSLLSIASVIVVKHITKLWVHALGHKAFRPRIKQPYVVVRLKGIVVYQMDP
jgi:hypothetical protein